MEDENALAEIRKKQDRVKITRDYKSMIYLLSIADTNPDEKLARDSIKEGSNLADKLEANPQLPNELDYEIIKADIEKVRRVYLEKNTG